MLEYCSATHIGRRRSNQEDAVRVQDLPDGGVALIVADGVAGSPAGSVASNLAVQQVANHLVRNRATARSIQYEIRLALDLAARSVWAAGEVPRQSGMSTTLDVAVVFPDGQAHLAHVGDGRQYIVGKTSYSKITREHRNSAGLLTSWLGSKEVPNLVDWHTVSLAPGDILLLCTDGLYSELKEKAIIRHLCHGEFPMAAQRLVMAAVEAGGRDNVTVAAVRLVPDAQAE